MESDMLWFLWQNMFCDKTKISIDNFYFCRQRIQKAKICLELSATHVIDDRKEVLAYLHDVGIKNLYLFQEREQEQGKFMEVVPLVKPVASWQEVAKELLS